uniref:AIG1-type G domain-containing protein n=1 Tax=Sinocyclocheilus grahami TaxID=75366 RepID=A0A672LHE5_SINGR
MCFGSCSLFFQCPHVSFLTEIRAVVLGWEKSDKASVINSILGDKVVTDKYFVKSVRKDGEVNGRKISLINTPCWWENYDLQDSPEVVKQELVCSVFLCPPGPHVFLLHLSLFGEKIWRHTIVLLTQTDSVKSADLQLIIQRCGERYHAFDFENKSVGVRDLLDKIDDVVAANNGKHFETHDDVLLHIQRMRDENERRAKARQETVRDKRDLLKEISKSYRHAYTTQKFGLDLC